MLYFSPRLLACPSLGSWITFALHPPSRRRILSALIRNTAKRITAKMIMISAPSVADRYEIELGEEMSVLEGRVGCGVWYVLLLWTILFHFIPFILV
jgi:hypothetical protein